MKGLILTFVILALLSMTVGGQNNPTKLDGNWLTTLEVSGMKLRLVLKVKSSADGSYRATLDSVDQGAKDLPIDVVTLEGHTMSFSAAALGMSYEGKLNDTGNTIDGTFKQGAGSTQFAFSRIADMPALKRSQDPVRPFPYAEEEVSYRNDKASIKLGGTLTYPHGSGPFPAVILITGSGTQDRDET